MARLAMVGSRVLLAVAAAGATSQAGAQNYPAKPVRVVVPSAAGGATDIQARLFSQKLTQSTGQAFVVDNKAGGSNAQIGLDYIANRVPADGYNVFAGSVAFTTIPALNPNPRVDVLKAFDPVIVMSKAPYVLVVHPSFPAGSMKEFLAWTKANPGKLNFALGGLRSLIHLGAAWMEEAADIQMTMIPFKGTGPATQELLSGRMHATFANPISVSPHIKSGKVRPLGVTTAERSPALPDVPTFAETGLKGYEVATFHGWMVTRGTPAPIIRVLNTELNRVLKQPDVVKVLAEDGGVAVGGTPELFGKLIVDEIDRWKRVVKAAGIKPEAD